MTKHIARVLIVALMSMGPACVSMQDKIIERELEKTQKFLASPGHRLEQVRGIVWSFRYGWYRNMVLISGDQIAVADPISSKAAAQLAKELKVRFPSARVTMILYSHSHHDHIRGAAELSDITASNTPIVAHDNVARELQLLGAEARGVTPPTETHAGDAELVWAEKQIKLLHLPRSHSDGFLAVYLPEEKTLYAPDLVSKKGGLALENDIFLPGLIAGQNRLIGLGAEAIIPGHYGMCTTDDLVRYRDMLIRMREIVATELSKQEGYDVTQWDAASFTRIQRQMRKEFGDVPGFNEALFTNTYYLVLGYIGGF